ncbi:MAG TPA: nicotinate-nucleotide adenylyltransferase [Thermoanaerobaculia bacterium]|nr:nicotinate-nucleotide adenylyltransferase [Thermoanaerobaculia bacterium]
MKLGLFGGSFDPIHRGHVAPVQEARRRLGLERVLYLPTGQPPHKTARRVAPPLARFAMVELALLAAEGLYVSGHELLQAGPAYTVETLEHFRAARPDAELHLLLGSDALTELVTWRRWRELVEMARLVVLQRPGWSPSELRQGLPPEVVAAIETGRILLLATTPCDVSASRLRDHLRRGETPPRGHLHPLVLDYARKYHLYDEEPPPL